MKRSNVHREHRKRTVRPPASPAEQHKAEAMGKVRDHKASIGLPPRLRSMRAPGGISPAKARRDAKK